MTKIPESTICLLFWKTLQAFFENCLKIPNITEDCDMDTLFQGLWDELDPFYKSLYGAFKDPSGQYIFHQYMLIF